MQTLRIALSWNRIEEANTLRKIVESAEMQHGETWCTPITKKHNGKRRAKAVPAEPKKIIHTSGMATKVCVKLAVAAGKGKAEDEGVALGQK